MIQEYYRQMRKFGCNILAVVQQYSVGWACWSGSCSSCTKSTYIRHTPPLLLTVILAANHLATSRSTFSSGGTGFRLQD
jgi:hypothetical protein